MSCCRDGPPSAVRAGRLRPALSLAAIAEGAPVSGRPGVARAVHATASACARSQHVLTCIEFKCFLFTRVYACFYLSIYISIYLHVCVSIHLHIHLSMCVCLAIYIFIYPYVSIYPFTYLCVYLSIYISIYPCVCLSIHLHIYPSVCESIYAFTYISIQVCVCVYLSIYISISPCVCIYVHNQTALLSPPYFLTLLTIFRGYGLPLLFPLI